MSNKGAIKKAADPKSLSKSKATPLRPKAKLSSRDSEENLEKNREPRIQDTRTSGDKLTKSTSLSYKSVLPDKNPVKLKQLKQNGLLSSSRSSIDESQSTSSSIKKTKKSQVVAKSSSVDKAKTTVRKSTKEKVQAHYNEKRGESTLYIPKSAASKLSTRSNSKASAAKIGSTTTKSTDKSLSKSKSSDKALPTRIRRRSRTLSPSEVKVLRQKTEEELFTGSPEVQEEAAAKVDEDIDEKYDGEDDFESYESDFATYSETPIDEESDHSDPSIDLEPIVLRSIDQKKTVNSAELRRAEEERMLDSGHYELTEARKRAALVESLMSMRLPSPPTRPEPRQATNQPYREEKQSETKSLPSSTDEGFEDARSGDFVKSPPVSQVSLASHEKLKQTEVKKAPPKVLTRGQILMSMIKLDSVGWSLYESQPISYDEYIRSFGKLNAQQASTQTNEDNVDVEIQTDTSDVENKWTQYPVKCRNNLRSNEDVRLFKIENAGVGGDNLETVSMVNPIYDALRLNEFLARTSRVMLALLEEKESGGNILQNETHDFPFSEGFIKLSVNSLSFLAGRQVAMLHYSEVNNKILVSVHASTKKRIETPSKQEYIMECCIGCVWNVNEPSRPIKLFYSQNPVTALCFHCTNNNIIFAGLQDGSVCLWDLREDETWHQKIIDKINEMDWVVRSPTYTTAGNWEAQAHLCPVIAIRVLSKVDQEDTDNFNDSFVSIQICSLDEDGHLIIWSVLRNLSANSDDVGLTPWGKVKLVKSQQVPLFLRKNELNNVKKIFVDMQVDSADSNNLYLATDNAEILHANSIAGRSNKSSYRISEMDSCASTTCIEACPFKESYFLAGCNDGSIRLHTSNIELPLLRLKNEKCSAGVKNIQWSKSKPMTIYVLDNQSRIFIWNLNDSDVNPAHAISTKSWGNVKCMRLSPCNTTRDMQNQYLALGTDRGNVEVHKLKKNFHYSQQNDFLKEVNKFLEYVSVL